MIKGLSHYHEEYGGRNDRTALVWLVHNNPQEYLLQVISGFCQGLWKSCSVALPLGCSCT